MMALSVLFFYGIINCITQRAWLAAAFTSLVIFDNALVIHSRAVHLDGIQLFFILAELYFLPVRHRIYHQRKNHSPQGLCHYWEPAIGLATSSQSATSAIELLLLGNAVLC